MIDNSMFHAANKQMNSIEPALIDFDALSKEFSDQSIFIALLHRMNSITRWTKSQCVQPESLNDHNMGVAFLGLLIGAHYKKHNPESSITPERLAVFCLFHDAAEILGEDLSGSIKRKDCKIKDLSKNIEERVSTMMGSTIDPELYPVIAPYFHMECSDIEKDLLKAADILSALIKAKSELRSNNADFVYAAGELIESLKPYIEKYDSVKFVVQHYLKAIDLTTDELIALLPLPESVSKQESYNAASV